MTEPRAHTLVAAPPPEIGRGADGAAWPRAAAPAARPIWRVCLAGLLVLFIAWLSLAALLSFVYGI